MIKCPYCKFNNIYQESIDHHMKYTHRPNHPSPPNEQLPLMSEKDKMDWVDALKGKIGRRSGLRVI